MATLRSSQRQIDKAKDATKQNHAALCQKSRGTEAETEGAEAKQDDQHPNETTHIEASNQPSHPHSNGRKSQASEDAFVRPTPSVAGESIGHDLNQEQSFQSHQTKPEPTENADVETSNSKTYTLLRDHRGNPTKPAGSADETRTKRRKLTVKGAEVESYSLAQSAHRNDDEHTENDAVIKAVEQKDMDPENWVDRQTHEPSYDSEEIIAIPRRKPVSEPSRTVQHCVGSTQASAVPNTLQPVHDSEEIIAIPRRKPVSEPSRTVQPYVGGTQASAEPNTLQPVHALADLHKKFGLRSGGKDNVAPAQEEPAEDVVEEKLAEDGTVLGPVRRSSRSTKPSRKKSDQ